MIEFDLGNTKVEIVVENQMGLDAVGKLFRDIAEELKPLVTEEEVEKENEKTAKMLLNLEQVSSPDGRFTMVFGRRS